MPSTIPTWPLPTLLVSLALLVGCRTPQASAPVLPSVAATTNSSSPTSAYGPPSYPPFNQPYGPPSYPTSPGPAYQTAAYAPPAGNFGPYGSGYPTSPPTAYQPATSYVSYGPPAGTVPGYAPPADPPPYSSTDSSVRLPSQQFSPAEAMNSVNSANRGDRMRIIPTGDSSPSSSSSSGCKSGCCH